MARPAPPVDFDGPGEQWTRWLPVMRVFCPAVLVGALLIAYPRTDPGGWRAPLAFALTAILLAAFLEMWVHRPIWRHSPAALDAHGVLLVASYAVLVWLSPGFAMLQVLIYPQVLFAMTWPRSIAAAMVVGAVSAVDGIVVANGDLGAALPWIAYPALLSFMFIAMAMVNRDAISQSLERRVLIDELTAARKGAADAERAAGVAQERARLAREIHDTLMQGFASVVTHLETADALLDRDRPRARDHLGAAEEAARSSLSEARTLVWALRPEVIAEAGLGAALGRMASTSGGPRGLKLETTISGRARQLHTDVEVTLLRAAQEGLANARRHAGATHVDVTLTYFDDVVTLDVADDGCGFDPADAARSGGLGLRGMRERVEALGGSLAIESSPGEGTVVAVTLPALEPLTPIESRVSGEDVGREAVAGEAK